MEVKGLKIGSKYYICDMSYHTYEGNKEVYREHYFNFTKEPLKLLNIGKFKTGDLFDKDECICNDIKLLHEKTGIILFSRSQYLKELKSDSVSYQNSMENLIITKSNIINNNLKGISNNYYITPDQYPLFKINKQLPIKEAQKQEFKIKKMSTKEKVKLLLMKLEYLIDKSIENSDKSKFILYSGRYNKIKELHL